MLAFMGKRNNVLYIFLMLKSLYNVQVLSGSGCGCAAPFTCESRRKERERETLGKDNVRDNGFSVVGWTFSAREAILH